MWVTLGSGCTVTYLMLVPRVGELGREIMKGLLLPCLCPRCWPWPRTGVLELSQWGWFRPGQTGLQLTHAAFKSS